MKKNMFAILGLLVLATLVITQCAPLADFSSLQSVVQWGETKRGGVR